MRIVLGVLLVVALAGVAWLVVGVLSDPTGGAVDEAVRRDTPAPVRADPALLGRGSARVLGADLHRGPGTIQGRVLDEQGAPVAGIRVELLPIRPEPEVPVYGGGDWVRRADEPPPEPLAALASTPSDVAGHFRLTGLALRTRYEIRAVPEAPWTGTTARVDLASPASARVELRVWRGAAVRGRVVDARGRGMRAWVSAHLPRDAPLLEGLDGVWFQPPLTTDDDGRFQLAAVPLGTLHVDARVPGRGECRCRPVEIPAEAEVLLSIGEAEDARVFGRVLSVEGTPVPEARVRAVVVVPGDESTLQGLATTASDGTYEVTGLPAGSLVRASASSSAGDTEFSPDDPPALSPGERFELDLRLEGRAQIRGTVRDEEGGPVPEIDVLVRGGPYRVREVGHDRTGADGRYVIEGVPLGPATIDVVDPGWSLPNAVAAGPLAFLGLGGLAVEVQEPGQVLTADLVVRRGVRVEGRVVDAGSRPVAGATVTARVVKRFLGRSGRNVATCSSDADGRFVFEALRQAESWRLEAATSTERSAPLADLRLGASEQVRGLVLKLLPTARLAGRVVDAGGRPQGGARVEFEEEQADTLTDRDGRFEFRNLYAGEHTLNARPGDGFGGTKVTRTVTLEPGEDRRDVRIEVEATLSVRGTAVDRDGAPLAGVTVHLRPVTTGYAAREYARTERDGSFEFEDLQPGRYRADVRGVDLEVEIEAGDEDVRLVVGPRDTWTLAGRVLDPDGQPVASAEIQVRTTAEDLSYSRLSGPVKQGAFSMLVPSTWPTVSFEISAALAENGTRLDVQAYRQARVTVHDVPLRIRLERGFAIAGRVVDGRGHGIEGVQVIAAPAAHPWNRRAVATTDGEGRFRAGGLAREKQLLTFQPRPGWARPQDLPVDPGTDDLEIVLERAVVLEGRVTDEEGAAVSGAVVVLTPGDTSGGADTQYEHQYQRLPSTQTDHEGRFRFGDLASGTWDITVAAPPGGRGERGEGWAFLRRVVEDVSTSSGPIAVELTRGVFIDVEVLDAAGEPATDCFVWISAESGGNVDCNAVPRGSHEFRSEAVAPGTYRVQARRRGSDNESPTVEVHVPADVVRLRLKDMLVLEGQIEGPGAAGFEIVFSATDDSGIQNETTSRTDGSFRLEVDGGARGVLLAYKAGDERYGLVQGVEPGGGPYRIPLQPGQSIAGRVPVEQKCRLMVRGPYGCRWTESTEGDGTFLLLGLPEGQYDLRSTLRTEDGYRTFRARGVAAGTRSLVLQPTPR